MRASLSMLAFAVSISCCHAQETPEIAALIGHYAQIDGVPRSLVERVVMRESRFNPRLHGRFWGLMQLRPATARALGYKGRPEGLLNPETNLAFGVLYLANAWRVAGGDSRRALRLYSRGYYYEAKRRGRLNLIQTAATIVPQAPTAPPQQPAAPARPSNPIAALLASLNGTK